jgi:CspA family cold shock protein
MSKTGTVKFFNTDKGYGFIQPDDGSADSFVHITAVQAAGMQSLDKDQRLNYEVEQGRNGKASAVNLTSAD